MSNPTPHPNIPTRAERKALNAALFATGTETGFWDHNGRPAPWPTDIDEWTPDTANPQNHSFNPLDSKGQLLHHVVTRRCGVQD